MKHNKLLWNLLVVTLLLAFAQSSVYAELNANEIYTTFNSTNGNQGFRFTYSVTSNGFVALTTQPGFAHVNFDAYMYGTTGGDDFFTTLCVEPDVAVVSLGLGLLNYDTVNGISQTTLGQVLSLGAAFLYKQYATGELVVSSQADMAAYYAAMQVLMGNTTGVSWGSNPYLSSLLDRTSDNSYWMNVYKPAQSYTEIGNFCVFVMEVTDSSMSGNSQNFLYISSGNKPPFPVPEPATLLFWSLGLGLGGSWWVRQRRRLKKLALA